MSDALFEAGPATSPVGSRPLDRVLAALERHGSHIKGSGGRRFTAQCPAHEDRNPSLSIADGDDRVLIKCHAGCATDQVVRALGLEWRELFEPDDAFAERQHRRRDEREPVPRMTRPAKSTKTHYPYHDADGRVLFETIRSEGPSGKTFTVRAPLGSGWTSGMAGADPIPYRLPEVLRAVASGAPVFIVEGEKCADTLAALGLVATTAPFGAGKWQANWAAYFEGASSIFVLPDNDPPGSEHADDVAEKLDGVPDELLIVELPDLPHGGDVADWLEAGKTKADLRAAVRHARNAQRTVVRDGITVIIGAEGRPQAWPWPQPLAQFVYEHSAAGEWAAYLDEAEVSEADPAAVLVQILTGLGAMVGLGPHIQHGVSRVPPRWYSLTVGQTSKARKGTSWEAARALLEVVDGGDFIKARTLSGFGSGEALLSPIADPDEDEQHGLLPQTVPERRLLIVETEFARVLDIADRTGSTLSPNLRDLFDTGPVRNIVKGAGGTIAASQHHCALVGHITAEELRKRLSSTAISNGFGNRLLLVGAKRPRLLPDPAAIDDSVRLPLASRLRDALDTARRTGQMGLTDDAKALWRELYTAMERRPLPPLASTMTGRAPIQTLRIALLCALIRGDDRVERIDLEVAAEIVRYSIDTVLHIFGDQLGDERADRLLQAAREAGHRGLTGKERLALFSRNATGEQLGEAVRVLTSLSLCALLRVPSRGGRPSEILVAAEALDAALTHYGASPDAGTHA